MRISMTDRDYKPQEDLLQHLEGSDSVRSTGYPEELRESRFDETMQKQLAEMKPGSASQQQKNQNRPPLEKS